MKISQAEFAHCVGLKSQLPEPQLPEFAFVGRSNVGKSSLINTLINRKSLARTSGDPGKTQTLNFYLVNQKLFLVDLPGYGYAKVAKTTRNKWMHLIEEYLGQRPSLQGVAMIVDSRHPPVASDVQMYQWLQYYRKPVFVVATKVDKLRQREYQVNLHKLQSAYSESPLVPFSSVKARGREQVWNLIKEVGGFDG